MIEILSQVVDYGSHINWFEAFGLVFGLVCVLLLIKENIWTWPTGIAYVLISFVIFYQAKLYADLALHVFFLALNIYGWYYWIHGKKGQDKELPVTTSSIRRLAFLSVISALGIWVSGTLLERFTDASLPYWDSTTSVLSIVAMWLQAKKKIEHWIFWLVVDVLATGIYIYKGIYFYSVLYMVYIGMAVSGYITWKRSMEKTPQLI